MSRAARREERARFRAQADRLWAEVHPPEPAEPSVAELVAAELDRRQRAEAEELERKELARFVGGPCSWCGAGTSAELDEEGRRQPAWYRGPKGPEDVWCHRWRDGEPDPELMLDRVATIVAEEGLPSLVHQMYRAGFHIIPGLAAKMSVVAWCDSGAPPAEGWRQRWAHLAGIAERTEERRRASEAHPRPSNAEVFEWFAARPAPDGQRLQRSYDADRGVWRRALYTDAEVAALEAEKAGQG